MFPCMIARATTTDVISSGMGGTRNGALQLVYSPNFHYSYDSLLYLRNKVLTVRSILSVIILH